MLNLERTVVLTSKVVASSFGEITRMRVLVLPVIAFLLTACSNQQIYNAVQENRRAECGKPPQSQYEECLRDYDTSYDEYERERQASAGDDRD